MSEEKDIADINNLEELLKIGKEYVEKERFDDGKKFIEKALSFEPNNINALNAMGFAHGRSGNYQEAIEWYKKALEIEPKFQKALGNLGHVYEMMEEFKLAIEFYEKALQVKTDNKDLKFPDEIIPVVESHLKTAREKMKK